ncbi:DM13 domain-containing protein [Actinomyces bowdenii]|uniref:DM13 domain-containing protein n=1 Tax=Actinomyces bowdenii TaxID=131109 RepID=UPI0035A3488C
MKFVRQRRRPLLILGAVGLLVLAAGLAVFKPWLLLVDVEVDDEVPVVAAAPAAPEAGGAEAGGTDAVADPTAQGDSGAAVVVSSGTFISHEHETSGTASIVRHPDGSHQLVLENLETSNGPDVRVWLSAGPVVEGRDGWFTAGEHEHLDVAPIKGNRGNQVYDLPEGFDPSVWPTVDLWCEDFSVSFGAAALEQP